MSDELTGTIVMIAFVIMIIAVAFAAVALSAFFSYGMIVSIIDDIEKRRNGNVTGSDEWYSKHGSRKGYERWLNGGKD